MGRSILLDGVLSEDAESARAYVWAYDHATVGGEIGRRFLRSEKAAPDTGDRHSQSDGLVAPMEPDDWRAAKLARIFQHLDLQFAGAPTEAELIDLCLQAESKAVDLLVKLESSIKPTEGASTFVGGSALDLSRHVLRKMFEQLDASFEQKPIEERERIAADIVQRLSELPEDVRERIRVEAGLADISKDALMRTGSITAVGGAMVGTVGIAGFAAYSSVTSVIAAAAGLVGMTLPFGFYTFATSALAFLSNPIIVGGVAIVGGRLAVKRANRQMRDRLLPVMVATSVVAATGTDQQAGKSIDLAKRLANFTSVRAGGDFKVRNQIDSTFPCLPRMV